MNPACEKCQGQGWVWNDDHTAARRCECVTKKKDATLVKPDYKSEAAGNGREREPGEEG